MAAARTRLGLLVGALPWAATLAAGPAPAEPPAEADFAALLEFLGETGAAEKGWDDFVASLPEDPDAVLPPAPKTEVKQ